MSNFWDNNKGAIMSGAAKGASVTGKYAWKGTKAVSKAGYQAAKNQREATKGGSSSYSTKDSPSPSFGEARPVSSLPDVSALPPPPLKPGQMQYHKTIKLPPATVQVGGHTVNVPSMNVDKKHAMNIAGSVMSGFLQQQGNSQPTQTQDQPTQPTQPVQQTQVDPLPLPQTIQQPSPTPAPVPSAQPMLSLNNPYYQGVVANPPAQDTPSQETSTQETSAPPPPARNYDRPAVSIPPQMQAQQQQPEISAIPSPDLSNLPVPPKTAGINTPPVSVPAQIPVTAPAQAPTSQKPDLPPIVTQPSPSLSSRTPISIPAVTVGGGLPAVSVGSGVPTSTGTSTPVAHAAEEEKPVVKGIAGTYDYKVDVKFAPPPKHMAMNTTPQGKHAISTGKKSSVPPAAPSRTGSSAKPPAPLPQRSSVGTSPAVSTNTTGSAGPPPPPARTSSTTHSTSNFPPPPKPTNPTTKTTNAFPPPPKPTNPHSHAVNAPSPVPSRASVVSPAASVTSAAPPPYAVDDPSTSNSSVPPPASPPPTSAQRPVFDMNKFAPPPKPFRKPDQETSTPHKVTSPPPTVVSPPPVRPKPEVNLPPPVKPKPSAPPPVKPKPSGINIDVSSKPKPPTPGPKPNISPNTKKPTPPPVKPKPSFDKATPPPVKPKPSALGGKAPPPVKPKPSGLSDKPSAPSKPASLSGFGNVVSELKKAESKHDVVNQSKDTKIDEEEEDFEDNPFKRYLKAAVPSQDDRFGKFK
ncbi:Altered inheritance of mitochondria protein 3 [Cyberlindnera fabianii]|uniref:Altered inheritance of mitochondria protein 3 n=1 Tax=Cyberlindnera fabianii TaxID=36022 RepID=A0A1V2L2C5_CYBFA|nr:Altered inheritance of mitochondria protein 3 [Cyberlindnera fabianii]